MIIGNSPPKPAAPYDFHEARFRCAALLPYTYTHVASLVPCPTPGLGTLGVDRWARLYYDPALIDQWNIQKFALAIEHEDLHAILGHCHRAAEYLGEKPTQRQTTAWNFAADLVVNQTLAQVAKIPDDWLMPGQHGMPDEKNLSVEEYYDLIYKDAPEEPQGGSGGQGGQGRPQGQEGQSGQSGAQNEPQNQPGSGGGGSAADNQPKPWEHGPPTNQHPGLDEYQQRMVEQATAAAIEAHEKGRGTVPSNLSRWARDIIEPPVDPYRELYSLTKFATEIKPGRGQTTFKRLPRRNPPGGLRLPCPIRTEPDVLVVVDTSGSMDEEDLSKALGMIELGTRHLSPGHLRVMSGDTEAKTCQKVFRNVSAVELIGGGGTDMGRLICQAADAEPAPDAILVVTDGWTPWPSAEVQPKVIAVLTRGEVDAHKIPDWIERVSLAGNR